MKYQKRKRYELKLSKRQLDQIRIIYAMELAVKYDYVKFEDVPNLNPDWWKIQADFFKDFSLGEWQVKNLKKEGRTDAGCLVIRKTKKGFIVSSGINWRSRGIKVRQVVCGYCKKNKKVNIYGICEKCEKSLKSKRQYKKFLLGKLK